MNAPTEEEWAKQEADYNAFCDKEVAAGRCPYSGLPGPECKSFLCDCFEFVDLWGVSRK